MNKKLSIEQKKSIMDLSVMIFFFAFSLFIYLPLIKNYIFVGNLDTIKFLLLASFEFMFAGLSASLIMLIRRENFANFGFVKKNSLKAILLSLLPVIPYIVYAFFVYNSMGIKFTYIPLRGAINQQFFMSLNLFSRIFYIIIVIIIWGFFEAFQWIVVNDKINKIFKPKNLFLNLGAISCALLSNLAHFILGLSTFDHIITNIVAFTFIYGMLIIREYTQNSWGCIFLFIFFWNAF